jgi:hypothetical protein
LADALKETSSFASSPEMFNRAARLLLAVAVCAGFAGFGSFVVVLFELMQGVDDTAFLLRTAVKVGAFGLLTAGFLAVVWWLTRASQPGERFDPITAPRWPHSWVGLAIALLIGAGIAFPRLNDMPRAEPDEMHHLIVAKNLGLEGKYASGTADAGFVYFDSYDSVGMPVIGPAAMAIRQGGVDVGPPRRVIAFYFLMLLVAAYALLQPAFGGRTAAFGAALLALAPMSPYLARTVYGEVPGLAWLLIGLVLWRMSWERQPS